MKRCPGSIVTGPRAPDRLVVPDDGLGELFLKMSKQGSTLAGVMDAHIKAPKSVIVITTWYRCGPFPLWW
jgi:hypothetical protein